MVSGGCAASRLGCPEQNVGAELAARTAHRVAEPPPGGFILPPDVHFDDGISEDEAVATALSNNSAFQATLMQLGMAHGDLVQAGLLTNPSLVTMIPVSVKQWEWTLYMPIETFILRPQRLALAESDYGRVASELVQNGLTLVRDVRVAHADLALAIEQWRLALEAVEIRQGIADLTQKRLDRGDISELETMTARIDALNAEASAALLEQQVEVARARLALLMGLPPIDDKWQATLAAPQPLHDLDAAALIEQALANRPDLHAAELAIDAADHRARVARWQFLRFDVGADANGKGDKGFEIGPGLRFDIPIFNRNQGGVMRADAQLQQALYNRDAVRDQIVQEIRTAVAQHRQAKNSLAILEQRALPSLDEALDIAEKGFADGGASYFLVLQATTQNLDVKARVLDQLAALQRARAELERSVGHRLAVEDAIDYNGAAESLPVPEPIAAEDFEP